MAQCIFSLLNITAYYGAQEVRYEQNQLSRTDVR